VHVVCYRYFVEKSQDITNDTVLEFVIAIAIFLGRTDSAITVFVIVELWMLFHM